MVDCIKIWIFYLVEGIMYLFDIVEFGVFFVLSMKDRVVIVVVFWEFVVDGWWNFGFVGVEDGFWLISVWVIFDSFFFEVNCEERVVMVVVFCVDLFLVLVEVFGVRCFWIFCNIWIECYSYIWM